MSAATPITRKRRSQVDRMGCASREDVAAEAGPRPPIAAGRTPRAQARRRRAPRSIALALSPVLVVSCSLWQGAGDPPQEPLPRERPRGLAELENGPPGRDLAAFLERAVKESEAYRRRLLEDGGGRGSDARLVARAIQLFERSARAKLSDRRTLASFTIDPQEMERWIAGTNGRISGEAIYDGFAGRWYGVWQQQDVDHDWGPYVALVPPRRIPMAPGSPDVILKGYQYAWVGDGYGVNLHATTDPGDSGGDYLLGYVVHVEDGDLSRETYRQAHVGVPTGDGRLIWLTSSEVFLEESYSSAPGDESYAITGFHYEIDGDGLVADRMFQAIYSRNPRQRQPWLEFDELDLSVSRSARG